MKEEFDFFALFVVICLSLTFCAPSNSTVERKLDKMTQEIHALNDNLSQIIDKGNEVEKPNDN